MITLACGGTLAASPVSLFLSFPSPRPALSTALWGGGLRPVRWALNQKLTGYWPCPSDFPGGSPEAFLSASLRSLGAVSEEACAFLTSAKMERYRRVVRRESSLTAEVIATGGVEKTAARAGDPPLYREEDGAFAPVGTINLMVLVSASLPTYAMVRALLSVTEGKTAALQDLGIASVSTGRPATGTATDGVMLFADPAAPPLTDAGTFSLLGSLLAGAARDAVRACLADFGLPWNAFPSLRTPAAADLSGKKPAR